MFALLSRLRDRLKLHRLAVAGLALLLLAVEATVGLSVAGRMPLPLPVPSILVMLAPLALTFTVLLFIHFEQGVMATVAAFLIPLVVFSFSSASFGVMPILVILLFGIYVVKGIVTEHRIDLDAPGMKPLLILVAVSVLSVVFSYVLYDPKVGVGREWSEGHRWVGYQAMGIFLFAYAGMAYVIAAKGIQSRKWLWATYVCALLVCLYVVLVPLPGYLGEMANPIAFLHPTRRLEGSNQGSAAMILALLTLAMLVYEQRPRARLVLAVLLALALLNLFLSYYLNTWLGFAAGAAVIAWKRGARTFVLFLLICLILLLLGWEIILLIQEQRLAPGAADLVRLQIWRNALQTWLESPIVGVGNANLASYTLAYGPFPVEWVASGKANPHNTYLGVLAENGVLGLACMLWLIWAYLKRMWSSVDQVQDPRLRSLTFGCLAVFVASTVTALFAQGIVPLYTAGGAGNLDGTAFVWILFGLGVAAVRINRCTSA